MPFAFFRLPAEIRNQIYSHILLSREPIEPWDSHTIAFSLGFLRVNKAIKQEASSLFWARNVFDLSTQRTHKMLSFLKKLNPHDAARIQHLLIPFPHFIALTPTRIEFDASTRRIRAAIQKRCTALRSLRTGRISTVAALSMFELFDTENLAATALHKVHALFSTLAPLQTVIIEVYDGAPSGYVQKEIARLGWVVESVEPPEEDFGEDYDDWGEEDEDKDGDEDNWLSHGSGVESYDDDSDPWRLQQDDYA